MLVWTGSDTAGHSSQAGPFLCSVLEARILDTSILDLDGHLPPLVVFFVCLFLFFKEAEFEPPNVAIGLSLNWKESQVTTG